MEELVKEKSARLLSLQHVNSPVVAAQIKQLQLEIEELLEKEDLCWKQRAKQHWLLYGDRNTTFFHSWMQHRRKINNIRSICDEQGQAWRKKRDISRVFLDYYSRIFSSQGSSQVEECISKVTPRVTEEMNSRLLCKFSEEEVQTTLFQMHPLQFPCPDGFHAAFYQKNWDTVGRDVCREVLDYLNGG